VVRADAIDPDDLPLIGEPLPVEFANSLYESAEGPIDFLATPQLAQLWFECAATDAVLPTRLRRADVDAIRELRDAARRLYGDLANDRPVDSSAVSVLNRHAARCPWSVQLELAGDGRLVVDERPRATGIDATLGSLAVAVIALAAGPNGPLLRQCSGPGCAMLFVKDHHKRRWCDQSCGHRARQADYYRRKKALTRH